MIRRSGFLLFALAATLFGVSPTLAQTTVSDSLHSQTHKRTYLVYLPKSYHAGQSLPLILHLHGYGSSSTTEKAFTNYMPIADTANFIVAYPDAEADSFGNQGWNVGWPGLGGTDDDVAFLSQLIDTLHAHYNIDLNRVYASGLSMGGFMCYQLAWKLSNRIVAIASVSGSMHPSQFAICKPTRVVPVMEIHGDNDAVIPYTGSVSNVDIDTLMKFWVAANGLLPLAGTTDVPDRDPNDGTRTKHTVWTAELTAGSCELFRILGGTHIDWPPQTGTGVSNDFSASVEIWRFFNQYRLKQFEDVGSEVVSADEPTLWPNPASTTVHRSTNGRAIVTDALGRVMLETTATTIDIHALPRGLYECTSATGGRAVHQKFIKQ